MKTQTNYKSFFSTEKKEMKYDDMYVQCTESHS